MTDNIIYDHHYQGLPLAIEHGPFLENRLADALATIENIMETNSRIVAVCFEVLVPSGHCNGFGFTPSHSQCVAELVSKLQRQARWKHTDLYGKRVKRRKPVIEAIWQESLTANQRSIYRVMLLLNHEAYFEQSISFDAADTLRYRARMAWAKAMQIHKHQSGAYIRFINHGLLIAHNDSDGLLKVFAKASALCGVPNQGFGHTPMGFGSTKQVSRCRNKLDLVSH